MSGGPHYLESELYSLVKTNSDIFDFLQKGSLDGIWYWDLKHPENEWMSPSFWRTFGYDAGEKPHLSEAWQDIIHPEDLKLATENFEKHAADADFPYDQVVRYRHKNGSTVWIRCRGVIIRDEEGQPTRMLGAHQDITQLKEAEENYRTARERFELAAKGASVGIWDWIDVNHNEEFWTTKFYELLGYEDKEIQASLENFAAMLHPDDKTLTFDAVNQHFEQMAPFDVEYRLKTKSGAYRWFKGTGFASRDENHAPKRMVGTIQDIHDKKLYQHQLESTIAKLKQSNEDLERFAYVASHDLQEPLRIVSSYAQLITKRYKGKLDPGADEFFGYIVDGCRRMQALINDLLEFSRLSNDKLTKESVDLNHLLESCKLSLGQSINESSAIIDATHLPTVVANRAQLHQLLQNLICNGIKYAKQGCVPKISISSIEVKDFLRISVRDNGIGMETKHLTKIFEIFQRLHAINEYSGTGIGLAICKRIVVIHGGEIWVESKVGKGSTFHFTLPRNAQ